MSCDYLFSFLEKEFFSRDLKKLNQKKNDFWEIFSNLFFSLSSNESYKFCYKYLCQYDKFLIKDSNVDLLRHPICENFVQFSSPDFGKKCFLTDKDEEENKDIQFLFNKNFQKKLFQDPFILLNWLMMDSYYFVSIADNSENHILNSIYISDSSNSSFYKNTVIYIKVNEEISNSIFLNMNFMEDSVSNISIYFDLEKKAKLKVYSVFQSYPSCSISFLNFASKQSLGACLELYNLAVSEGNVRNNIDAFLFGKQAYVKSYSLSHIKNTGYFDLNTNMFHCEDDSLSNQLYKGVLEDSVETVFYGNVHVQEHIKNIEASQASKVLILSDKSSVHMKPQLDIFSDEVKCSHKASVCQLEPEMVFYMASRGISGNLMKILFVKSFYSEFLEAINNKDISNKFFKILSEFIVR